jgi:hypothetical protein
MWNVLSIPLPTTRVWRDTPLTWGRKKELNPDLRFLNPVPCLPWWNFMSEPQSLDKSPWIELLRLQNDLDKWLSLLRKRRKTTTAKEQRTKTSPRNLPWSSLPSPGRNQRLQYLGQSWQMKPIDKLQNEKEICAQWVTFELWISSLPALGNFSFQSYIDLHSYKSQIWSSLASTMTANGLSLPPILMWGRKLLSKHCSMIELLQ